MKVLRRPVFYFEGIRLPFAPACRSQQSLPLDGAKVVAEMAQIDPAAVGLLRKAGLTSAGATAVPAGCNCLADGQGWEHVAEHCCAVGLFVHTLAESLCERHVWSLEQKRYSTKLALLHDCAKRVELAYFGRSAQCPRHSHFNADPSAEPGYVKEVLSELGFVGEEIELVYEARSCSSLSDLDRFCAIEQGRHFRLSAPAMGHLIVQLADACTATNYHGVRGSAFMHPALRISATGLHRRFPHFPRVYAANACGEVVPLSASAAQGDLTPYLTGYPAVSFLREIAHALAWSVLYLGGDRSDEPLEKVLRLVSGRLGLVG